MWLVDQDGQIRFADVLGRGVPMAQKDDVRRNLLMGPPLFVNRNVIGLIEIYKLWVDRKRHVYHFML